ncbi:hypothetical protein FACS1894172_17730 [Spirochaetia bacterium]|nr:hypothetical protein FACS1894164_15650 [Spirochaetia bacterium]GHU35653.1 hypothetical protein FACS1894172_17730 [Spirochaetia bacterium]
MKTTKNWSKMLLVGMAVMVLAGCPTNIESRDPNVFAVDISEETDWNYLVVGKDGSSLFLDVTESTGIPTRAYLKPDKDSDVGFTYLFKENGLPDEAISNGHVLYFGNFSGYTFDLAVIYPNNTIEYHYGIETDINFDVYNETTPSPQVRYSGGRYNYFDNFGLSDALGIFSCMAAFAAPPFWATSCATYVVGEVINAVTGEAELVGGISTFQDSLGCMGGDWFSCISMVAGAAELGFFADSGVVNQKAPEIAQANGTINGGRGDVKVTLSWDNLADVDLHVVDPSGEQISYYHKNSQSGGELDFDNMYGYGPENIYWPTGGAPNGTYDVYVNFYGIGTSGAYNSSSNYTVVIRAFGRTQTYQGVVTSSGGLKQIATFNRSGIYGGDGSGSGGRQVVVERTIYGQSRSALPSEVLPPKDNSRRN